MSEIWGLPPMRAAYLPVGFGSHHWTLTDAAGRRWFASVDALPARDPEKLGRLSAALGVAVAARDRALPFVVAPVRTSEENADTAWSWDALQDTLSRLDAVPSPAA